MSSSIPRPGCIFDRIASWALMLMGWITCTSLCAVNTVVKCFTSHFSLKRQIKNRAQRWESGVNQIQTLSSGPSCQPSTDQTRMRLDTPQIALLRSGDAQAAIFALFQRLLSPVTVGDGVWQIGEGDGVNLTAASASARLPVIKHETAEWVGGLRDWQADGRAACLEMETEIPGRPQSCSRYLDCAELSSAQRSRFFFNFPETGASNWNPLCWCGFPNLCSKARHYQNFFRAEKYHLLHFFPIQMWPQLASANN